MTKKDVIVLSLAVVMIVSFIMLISMPNSVYFDEHLTLFVILTKVIPMGVILGCVKIIEKL